MARMSNRTARIVKWSALPAALLVSGLVVSQASYSAFSANTVNPTDTWSSGAIVLNSDAETTALFAVSNIKPGDWGSKCITVTASKIVSDTTVKMQVRNAAAAPTSDQTLAAALYVKITNPTAACTPSTTAITTATGTALKTLIGSDNIASTVWTPAAALETKSYLIDWVFDPAATQATYAGKSASVDFVWQADQGAGKKIG